MVKVVRDKRKREKRSCHNKNVVSRASPIPLRSTDRFQYLPPRADTESDRRCGTEWGWLARLIKMGSGMVKLSEIRGYKKESILKRSEWMYQKYIDSYA